MYPRKSLTENLSPQEKAKFQELDSLAIGLPPLRPYQEAVRKQLSEEVKNKLLSHGLFTQVYGRYQRPATPTGKYQVIHVSELAKRPE